MRKVGILLLALLQCCSMTCIEPASLRTWCDFFPDRGRIGKAETQVHKYNRGTCMAYLSKALVACCDCGHRKVLVNLVARCGLKPVIATSTREGVSLLGSGSVCVAFCQDDLPG